MTNGQAMGADDGSAERTFTLAEDASKPLAESAPRLLLALEAAQVDAFDWDFACDRIHGVGALNQEHGLSVDGSPIAGYLDRVHPEDREQLTLILARLSADAPRYTAAYRVRAASGAYLQVVDSGRAHFDGAGQMLNVLGTRRRLEEVQRVEQALREGEERYRTLLQAVPSMTFEGDTEGGNVFASEQWCAYTGMTPEQTAGFGWTQAVHPDDLSGSAAHWAQAVRDGEACEMRHRIRAADGSYRWFLLRSRPLRDAHGRIERWVGSLTDVEDLLRTEQALRESERRYRDLVQNANSAIIRWRKDGTLAFFNEFAEQFFGYRADEVLGKGVGILVPEQDSEGVDLTQLLDDIVCHPDRHRNNVNENICRNGRRVWMSWTNRPILDERGEVIEILAVGSDITERIRIEQALRYQLHLNQSITDKATDSIFVTDAYGRVTFMNPEAQRVFGYAAEELRGRLVHDAIHHHDADGRPLPISECALCRVYDTGEVVRDHEDVFFHRDGSKIIATASNATLEFDGRKLGAALILHDITERKRAESLLFDTNQRLSALMQALPVGVSFSDDVSCHRATGNPMLLTQFEMTPQDNVSASAPDRAAAGARVRYFHEGRELADVELPLQRAAAENRVITPTQLEVWLPSGRIWFAEVSGAPLHDGHGNVISGIAVVVDITERTLAERALRESEERFQLSAEIGRSGTWDWDVRTDKVIWSRGHYEILGYRIDAMTPSYAAWADRVHPEDRPSVEEAIRHSMASRSDYASDFRVVWPNGSIHWMSARARYEYGEDGACRRMVGVMGDVTELKQAERQLRELNERLTTLLAERTGLAEARAEHLRELAGELTRAEQRERDRLYELLHDHVQPLLVAARLTLSGLDQHTPIATWMRIAADASSHITEALDTARSLSVELNPPLVREQGLGPALDWLCRWVESRHGLLVDLEWEAAAEPSDAATRLMLFKAVRELLMNVAKHAGASQVTLNIERVPGVSCRHERTHRFRPVEHGAAPEHDRRADRD